MIRVLLPVLLFGPALAAGQALPTLPARNVSETFFGVAVDDPYRATENTADPEVAAWIRAHADHARRTLDAIPGRSALLARVKELDESASARVHTVRRLPNGVLFFERRGKDEDQFKLWSRRGTSGTDVLLVDPEDWRRRTGKPHAINYYEPSPDGRYVAYGISAAGSEDAVLHVIEVATRREVTDPIDRARFGGVSWLPDGRSFFYTRSRKLADGAPATERYLRSQVFLHRLGRKSDEDHEVLGAGSEGIAVDPAELPFVSIAPGSRWAVAGLVLGTQRELRLYVAPLGSVGKNRTLWRPLAERADKVTAVAVHGDFAFLRTHRDSTRSSILRADLRTPGLAGAVTVLPASELVVNEIAAARDALYVERRDGAVKRLVRVPYTSRKGGVEEVELPFAGSLALVSADTRIPGILLEMSSWDRAIELYRFDPTSRQVTSTGLYPLGKFDRPAGLVTTEVRVKSHDGAMVPLSIIHRKGIPLDGSAPALLYAYGAYGVTEDAYFQPRRLAWLERGGVYAVANVRGSGAFGEDWYKAGFKATKPNTWKDLIACAEYLVNGKFTSPRHLGILGGSAGGIAVGRALTERPDLFAAVVPAVGVMDTVRAETTAIGVHNIPEFGTVKREDEFRALLAMSSYHHVRDATAYPAVLLIHGFNDPRVEPWHSVKMAARLLAASSSGKPVLLDIDFDSGHGIGNTKAQIQRQTTDVYSFLLWHAGVPEFQPR